MEIEWMKYNLTNIIILGPWVNMQMTKYLKSKKKHTCKNKNSQSITDI